MIWEKKTELIRLGNQRDNSTEAKREFQQYVLDNIEEFDMQAWDMFAELSDILIDEMKDDYEYWERVYPYLIGVDCNDEGFGFRSGMRIAMLQTICEDELKLNEKL
jgi:hypothetical protein